MKKKTSTLFSSTSAITHGIIVQCFQTKYTVCLDIQRYKTTHEKCLPIWTTVYMYGPVVHTCGCWWSIFVEHDS